MTNIEFLTLKKMLSKFENLHASFDYVKITLASSKRIKKWSERLLPNGEVIGEVLLPETLNFKTNIPNNYNSYKTIKVEMKLTNLQKNIFQRWFKAIH